MRVHTLVIATRNPHKVEEFKSLFKGADLTLKDLRDFPGCPDVEEDGETLEENALKKARSAFACTGLPSISDDTGLEVHYLLGEPGVRSARYAGENATYDDNVRKLLRRLTQVPARKRQARFRTALSFVWNGPESVFEGRIDGVITLAPSGENGFGYDPIFKPTGCEKTLAELELEEKNVISHRAKAVQALLEYLSS